MKKIAHMTRAEKNGFLVRLRTRGVDLERLAQVERRVIAEANTRLDGVVLERLIQIESRTIREAQARLDGLEAQLNDVRVSIDALRDQ